MHIARPRNRHRGPVAHALLALTLASPCAAQDVASFVIALGDLYAGRSVMDFGQAAVNSSADWMIAVRTNHPSPDQNHLMVRSGAVALAEGDALAAPAGATVDNFGPFDLDDAGNVVQVIYLDGTASFADDTGLYRNGALLIQEGDVVTAPQFSPGTTYRGFLNVKSNAAGTVLALVAAVNDPAVSSPMEVAVLRVDLDGSGNITGQTAIARLGDILPGQSGRAARSFGTGLHQLAVNASGEIAYFVDLEGDPATDGAIYRDLTLIAQEGGPAPDAGRTYESLGARSVALDDAGTVAFRADLDDSVPQNDDVVIQGSTIVARQGDRTFPSTPIPISSFGLPHGPSLLVDGGGKFTYFARLGPFGGLSVQGQEFIRQSDAATTIDGSSPTVMYDSPGAIAVSRAGDWLAFRVRAGISDGLALGLTPSTDAPLPALSGGSSLRVFPSPSRGAVDVRWAIARRGPVTVDVHDVAGRRVATLAHGPLAAGEHRAVWSGRNLSGRRTGPGVYFVRLSAPGAELRSRVVVVR